MAIVVNRSTRVDLPSVDPTGYDPAVWLILTRSRDNSDYSDLKARGVPNRYWKITGERLAEMSQAEKDAVEAAELPALKREAMVAVEARTEELLSTRGFLHGGNRFPLTPLFRDLLAGYDTLRSAPSFPYPLSIGTIDDAGAVAFNSASEIRSLYVSAVTRMRAVYDAGADLKAQIRAAATVAELRGIVDGRT